jgi:GNAT superfamily N-acetyltransferase
VSSPLAVRPAVAGDAAAVAAVQRAAWIAAYSGIVAADVIDRITAPDEGARIRQTFLTRPWQRMLVAVGDGGVVGYASFGAELDVLGSPWPHPRSAAGSAGSTGELYALYVHPDRWSTGAGRVLMATVLQRLASAGYERAVLWVLEENDRARRFYARAGFAPDGARNTLGGLGGVPEVRYRRDLPPSLAADRLLARPAPAPLSRRQEWLRPTFHHLSQPSVVEKR